MALSLHTFSKLALPNSFGLAASLCITMLKITHAAQDSPANRSSMDEIVTQMGYERGLINGGEWDLGCFQRTNVKRGGINNFGSGQYTLKPERGSNGREVWLVPVHQNGHKIDARRASRIQISETSVKLWFADSEIKLELPASKNEAVNKKTSRLAKSEKRNATVASLIRIYRTAMHENSHTIGEINIPPTNQSKAAKEIRFILWLTNKGREKVEENEAKTVPRLCQPMYSDKQKTKLDEHYARAERILEMWSYLMQKQFDGKLDCNIEEVMKRCKDFEFKRLGNGAFGEVFKLTHTHKGQSKEFALKRVCITQRDLVKKEWQIYRERINNLSSNNFIKQYAVGFDMAGKKQYCYILMEYCDGCELLDLINKHTLSLSEMKNHMYTMIKTLSLLTNNKHDFSVLHRDIKHENIMIAKDLTLKFIDFGLSTSDLDGRKKLEPSGGTPGFIAPELLRSRCGGYKADIYALGVVFYQMLVPICNVPRKVKSGEVHAGNHDILAAAHFEKQIQKRDDYDENKEYFKDLQDLIEKMMKYDPCSRHDFHTEHSKNKGCRVGLLQHKFFQDPREDPMEIPTYEQCEKFWLDQNPQAVHEPDDASSEPGSFNDSDGLWKVDRRL